MWEDGGSFNFNILLSSVWHVLRFIADGDGQSLVLYVYSDPLTVSDLNLGGTDLSCLAQFGGPVMPWVALGGFAS